MDNRIEFRSDDTARSHGARALEICQMLGCRFGKVRSLCNLADVARELRDLPAARHHYEQALRLAPVVDDRWVEAVVQFEFCDVVRLQGNYGRAHTLIERGLAVAHDMGYGLEEALATVCLGRLYVSLGEYAHARDAPELRVEGLLLQTVLCQQTGDWEGALASAEQTYRTEVRSCDSTWSAQPRTTAAYHLRSPVPTAAACGCHRHSRIPFCP